MNDTITLNGYLCSLQNVLLSIYRWKTIKNFIHFDKKCLKSFNSNCVIFIATHFGYHSLTMWNIRNNDDDNKEHAISEVWTQIPFWLWKPLLHVPTARANCNSVNMYSIYINIFNLVKCTCCSTKSRWFIIH